MSKQFHNSNRKLQKEAKSTHKYMYGHLPWLGTGTSVKSGGPKPLCKESSHADTMIGTRHDGHFKVIL
jgi:hypothetical protein